jgi:hypothetical protein
MKLFGIRIISDAKFKRLTGEVSGFINTEADRVVLALKQTSLGDAVLDSIEAIADDDMPGNEKFQKVVSEVAPLVLHYVASGGVPALLDDVEDLARHLVQSVYNDMKSTGFGKLVKQLVDLLGL